MVPALAPHETSAEFLARLDTLERFVFHGSPHQGLVTLAPRPAQDVASSEWGNDTAVYAGPALIAIGRAILPPREQVAGRARVIASRNPHAPGGPRLVLTSNVKLGRGSVYVLDRTAFIRGAGGLEWKCHRRARVRLEVEVGVDDFRALGGRVMFVEPEWDTPAA